MDSPEFNFLLQENRNLVYIITSEEAALQLADTVIYLL